MFHMTILFRIILCLVPIELDSECLQTSLERQKREEENRIPRLTLIITLIPLSRFQSKFFLSFIHVASALIFKFFFGQLTNFLQYLQKFSNASNHVSAIGTFDPDQKIIFINKSENIRNFKSWNNPTLVSCKILDQQENINCPLMMRDLSSIKCTSWCVVRTCFFSCLASTPQKPPEIRLLSVCYQRLPPLVVLPVPDNCPLLPRILPSPTADSSFMYLCNVKQQVIHLISSAHQRVLTDIHKAIGKNHIKRELISLNSHYYYSPDSFLNKQPDYCAPSKKFYLLIINIPDYQITLRNLLQTNRPWSDRIETCKSLISRHI